MPPDIFGDEHKGASILRQNMGQVFDTDGNQRNDVAAYFEGSPVGLYLRDSSRVSFTYHVMHNDSITPDTTYRVDVSVGATKLTAPDLLIPAAGVSNYYRGKYAVEQVPAFRRAIYQEVFDRIDLHVYGSSGGPRLAYVVQPGGDPANIKLVFNGQDSLGIDWQGALKVYMVDKWIELKQAVAYQVAPNGSITTVNWTANYELDQSNAVAYFHFDTYNQEWPLVLQIGYEPMALDGGDLRDLNWSTYMGGSGNDELTCVETDLDGDPYFCGYTLSYNFPVAPGNQVLNPAIGQAPGWDSAVLMRFDKNNKQLIWATYYGGTTAAIPGHFAKTEARKIAVYTGLSGDLQYVFATGVTNCEDFPSMAELSTPFTNGSVELYTGGVSRMWVGAFRKGNGICDWASTSGETGDHTWYQEGLAIAIDPAIGLAVGGRLWKDTGNPGYTPITPPGAFQQNVGGAFIMHFGLDFQPAWSTAFGGYDSALPPFTQITDLCFHRNNTVKLWVTGSSQGPGLQYTPPPGGTGFYHDYSGGVFLASFDMEGHQLEYCTGWGEVGFGIAYGIKASKALWIVGGTENKNLTEEDLPNPAPGNPQMHHSLGINITYPGVQNSDAFVLAFDPFEYELKYGTLIGGLAYDMLVDVSLQGDKVYLIGETRSTGNFGIEGSSGAGELPDLDANWYHQPLHATSANRDVMLFALKDDMESPDLVWSTAYGGTLSERGWGIAANTEEVYITGATASNAWNLFPLKEFDPVGPWDYYQDFLMGGGGISSLLEFYGFDFGLLFEHYLYGSNPEPYQQGTDAFIASFSSVDLPVGIQDEDVTSSGLHIIPLPAVGRWTVHFPGPGPWALAAWNAAGQPVGHWESGGASVEVDLSGQAAGLYLLSATQADGRPYFAKVIRP